MQSAVERANWVDVYPTTLNLNSGYIEFEIVATDEYIDLNDTMLTVTAAILAADGAAHDATKVDAAFVNMPLYALFSDAVVFFNDDRVAGGDQTFAYKAIMSTLLSNNEALLKQQGISCGFIKDIAGSMDVTTATGHGDRKKWLAGKMFMGRLLLDIF